jgi:hypothetical protein
VGTVNGSGLIISKLSDSDAENGETDTWLAFAHSCGYLDEIIHSELAEKC